MSYDPSLRELYGSTSQGLLEREQAERAARREQLQTLIETERARREAAELAERELRQQANEAAKLQRLAEQRQAEADRRKAAEEEMLRPHMERARAEWLVTHFREAPETFDQYVWPRMRPLVLAQVQAAHREAARRSFRANNPTGF